MTNYIDCGYSNKNVLHLSKQAEENLRSYAPKGCPFKDYSLLDLLLDLMCYTWKIKYTISVEKYIRLLQSENYAHAVTYGDAIIKCLEA